MTLDCAKPISIRQSETLTKDSAKEEGWKSGSKSGVLPEIEKMYRRECAQLHIARRQLDLARSDLAYREEYGGSGTAKTLREIRECVKMAKERYDYVVQCLGALDTAHPWLKDLRLYDLN